MNLIVLLNINVNNLFSSRFGSFKRVDPNTKLTDKTISFSSIIYKFVLVSLRKLQVNLII